MSEPLIQDWDRLIGVKLDSFGEMLEVKFWDDGFGPLWVYRDTMGVVGVVRAKTWETAWECVLDELLTPIPENELDEAYDPDCGGDREEGMLAEGYYYQPNWGGGTGIVAIDLNGDRLERLTPELAKHLSLVIEIEKGE